MPVEAPLVQSIRLHNFLSFGSEPVKLDLKPLNILIGPNGSGKSNLIEAIDLMRSTPVDLADAIREKGGISEFLWKGSIKPPVAQIELSLFIDNWLSSENIVKHKLSLAEMGERFYLKGESIEDQEFENGQGQFYYQNQNDRPMILADRQPSPELIDINDKNWVPNQSILKQRSGQLSTAY